MHIRLSTALAGAAMLLATPALAQPEPVSIAVNTADLDLASQSGRDQLDRRLRHAADAACDLGVGGAGDHASYQSCRSNALAAVSQDVARLAQAKSNGVRLARNSR